MPSLGASAATLGAQEDLVIISWPYVSRFCGPCVDDACVGEVMEVHKIDLVVSIIITLK